MGADVKLEKFIHNYYISKKHISESCNVRQAHFRRFGTSIFILEMSKINKWTVQSVGPEVFFNEKGTQFYTTVSLHKYDIK